MDSSHQLYIRSVVIFLFLVNVCNFKTIFSMESCMVCWRHGGQNLWNILMLSVGFFFVAISTCIECIIFHISEDEIYRLRSVCVSVVYVPRLTRNNNDDVEKKRIPSNLRRTKMGCGNETRWMACATKRQNNDHSAFSLVISQ